MQGKKTGRILGLMALAGALALSAHAKEKPCVTADEAAKLVSKDVCVTAHVYDVVQLPDGTRYLDICSPDTSDDRCQFTLISLWEDREEVGELLKYRGEDVHVRGIVRPMHGRAGLQISHMRQFYGGPEKFKPNPRLLHGFEGDSEKAPVRDPNLQGQGHARSFMNTRDQTARPTK
jgi:hypothetical protein